MANNFNLGVTKNGMEYKVSDTSPNSNTCIIGMSGSGKTTTGVHISVQAVEKGLSVVSIGQGRSNDYSDLPEVLKERYDACSIRIDVKHEGVKMKLLNKGKDKSEDDNDIARTRAVLEEGAELSKPQSMKLQSVCRVAQEDGAYNKEGISSIGRIMEYSSDPVIAHVLAKLEPVLSYNLLRYGELLEYGDPCIYEYDLNGLPVETQKMVTKMILRYLYELALEGVFKEKPILIYLDECHNLDFSFESTISTLIREGRKMGVNFLFSTQNLFQGKGKHDMSILLQCATKIYMRPSDDEKRKIAKLIDSKKADVYEYRLSMLEVGEYIAVGDFECDGKTMSKKEPVIITDSLSWLSTKEA